MQHAVGITVRCEAGGRRVSGTWYDSDGSFFFPALVGEPLIVKALISCVLSSGTKLEARASHVACKGWQTPYTMAVPRAAYKVVVGGILLHISLGTLYSWGCIQQYVTSYIR